MLAWRFVMTPDKRCVNLSAEEAALLADDQTAVRIFLEPGQTEEAAAGPQLEASVLKARYLDNLNMLEAKHANGERVSGLVVADTKGGFSVALGVSSFEEVLAGKGIRAFMPRKQSGGQRTSRDEIRGLHGEFLIKELDVARGNCVVSRKEVASEIDAKVQAEVWSQLEEGQLVVGQVKNIVRYGAFVSLNGVDALLHQNDLVGQSAAGSRSHPVGPNPEPQSLGSEPGRETTAGRTQTDDTRPL